jgi:pyochelin biosynthetic protein PchC
MTGRSGLATAHGWLRRYRPSPLARVRLVCLPHASGNASFYRTWAAGFPDDVEVVAVQYPGRLDRITEPCVTDMDAMVASIAVAVGPLLDGPVCLFGHSMGAAVGYEVAHLLERWYGVPLHGLFVSGHPAPHHHRPGVKHLGSDDVLWDEVRRLGGTTQAVLDMPELRTALLPALRADYRLMETYRPTLSPPLLSPIVALTGDCDPEVDVHQAAEWGGYTDGRFACVVLPGDHFYLVAQRQAVTDAILGAMPVTR